MVVEENRKMTELSRELGLPYETLRSWVQEYGKNDAWRQMQKKEITETDKYKTLSDYKKEIKGREKEINRLAEENEILKEAMTCLHENWE